MGGDQVFPIVVGAGAIGVGLLQILAAERLTAGRQRRVDRTREKYAHRPMLLRPGYANSRPTVRGTRLTGLGFCVLGVVFLLVGTVGPGLG